MGTYCRVSGIFVAFIGATFAAENCWSTGVFGPKINNVVYGIDWRPGFFERAGDRCYTEGWSSTNVDLELQFGQNYLSSITRCRIWLCTFIRVRVLSRLVRKIARSIQLVKCRSSKLILVEIMVRVCVCIWQLGSAKDNTQSEFGTKAETIKPLFVTSGSTFN